MKTNNACCESTSASVESSTEWVGRLSVGSRPNGWRTILPNGQFIDSPNGRVYTKKTRKPDEHFREILALPFSYMSSTEWVRRSTGEPTGLSPTRLVRMSVPRACSQLRMSVGRAGCRTATEWVVPPPACMTATEWVVPPPAGA